jgi:hypothetical protein
MLPTNSGGRAELHDGHSSGITTSGSSALQNGHLKSMHVLPQKTCDAGSIGGAFGP